MCRGDRRPGGGRGYVMAKTERSPGEHDAWLALCLIPEVGAATFHRLVGGLGSPEAGLKTAMAGLAGVPGVSREAARAIADFRWREALDRELRIIETRGFTLRRFGEEGYPEPLAAIPAPPATIYLGGALWLGDRGGVRM